jgi:hypothetical protein
MKAILLRYKNKQGDKKSKKNTKHTYLHHITKKKKHTKSIDIVRYIEFMSKDTIRYKKIKLQ